MKYIVERTRAADTNQAKIFGMEDSSSEEIKCFGPYDNRDVALAVAKSMAGIGGPMSMGSRMSTRIFNVEYREPRKYIDHCIERQEDHIKEGKKSRAAYAKMDREYLAELKKL